MKQNVLKYLNETSNTTITFINTFNALSVPRIKDFLKYILDLRQRFSKDNQGIKYIAIHDPYHKHPDYEIHPRQRVWFDLPILRYPAWQSINILPSEFERYLEDAISFMKENSNTDNFDGFYDFEIDKLERNLAIMQERSLSENTLNIDRQNFVKYFDQYDQRKNTNLVNVFPEFSEIYNSWKG